MNPLFHCYLLAILICIFLIHNLSWRGPFVPYLLISIELINESLLTNITSLRPKVILLAKKIVNKRHFFIVIINHDITQTDVSVILNSVEMVDTLQPCGCDWTPCRVNGTCCPVEVKLDNLVQVNRKYITGNKVSPKLLRFQLF